MFLHPESFRLPARLQRFQLMDSHAYFTTGLDQGLSVFLIASPRTLLTIQQDAQSPGVASIPCLVTPSSLAAAESEVQKLEVKMGGVNVKVQAQRYVGS